MKSPIKSTYIRIPTYDPECEAEYDYARSHTVAVQKVDGVRLVMGGVDDDFAPDVLVERAVGLWRVFVHSDRGDPLCIIEIHRYRATIETDRGETLLDRKLP